MAKLLIVLICMCSILSAQSNYFIAIDIPSNVEEKFSPIINTLERRLMGQFEPIEQLHITLCFLGKLSQEELAQTREQMQQLLSNQTRFEITVQGLGCFPHQDAARVLWMEPHSPRLYELHQLLKKLALKPEDSFQPHITLARVSPSPPKKILEDYRQNIAKDGVITQFEVKEIVLFHSDQGKYIPIFSVPLH